MTPTHLERSCRKDVKCNSCGNTSHMTKFCVRKAQEKQGRVYAMQYNEDSEGDEDTDEEEDAQDYEESINRLELNMPGDLDNEDADNMNSDDE